jgi:hypothetical protein
MAHKIVKQVSRPDYGQVPGTQFPYDHEFDEPVYWDYVIVEVPDPPKTERAPAKAAHSSRE